ncbi:hypothetical protein FNH06_17280 [Amycolatopsis acidiphila]|uniref:ClpX-type ZB domain-containing protein n=2 Tax=Amycolatopsis acidiphila TaxID=715473 RepID=A0A558AAU1_9PSEU|nr:hypothetical protein FNH06_17280 [Amycolatopsis acidiphila]
MINATETTQWLVNARTAPCRFCEQPGTEGRYRAPGPLGPICPECLDAGRKLCQDGQERILGDLKLARLVTAPGDPCEFCGRGERRDLLRRSRPLPRMRCVQGEAVICADCLILGGRLLAHVSRARRG